METISSGGRTQALQLVAVGGAGEGRVIAMRDGTVLGRATGAGGNVDAEDVSRNHARLHFDDRAGHWQIEDLSSCNGTWVNGARVAHRALLRLGDILRLGAHTTFTVAAHDPIEDELRERQRFELVGRLSAGFVHDFNNMIGAGLANVEYVRTLSAAERAEGEGDDALEDTYIALQRAADLASRLLHAARPDQGEARVIDVSRLCDEVASMLRRVIPLSIRMEPRVSRRLHARGYGGSLQQVLVNLCLNARDAMPGGGLLTIDASLEEEPDAPGWLAIRVTDTGTGMDEETRRRIFEPFFTTKAEGRGFGLGLAMSAGIVAQHGGRIEVESEVGRGSIFTVRIPAARRSSTPTAQGLSQVIAKFDGKGDHILVVDDQSSVRRGLRRILERAHFRVLEASDGIAALGLVASSASKPQIALVDFDMPGMNGIETCRALRSVLPDLHTILMSGGTLDAPEMNPPDAPIASRLQKPIEGLVLLQALARGAAPA